MSAGLVTRAERQASEALATPVQAAQTHVQTAPIVHADETGGFGGRVRAWLWVAATLTLTVFRIVRHRTAEMARELLGERFAGYLITDRYAGYL